MNEDIVLMIEGAAIKCAKAELVSNSDYFKAMFEGNFCERDKSVVTLQDIRKDDMYEILFRLRDAAFVFTEDNLLKVLQTACMLQFSEIRDICVMQLSQGLSPCNALEIWFVAESLNVRELHLKAKMIALSNFKSIKDTNLSDLSLQQLRAYLANVQLRTENELDVFVTLIRWYSENCDGDITKLKKLLHCIDFSSVSEKELEVMQMNECIAGTRELRDLFNVLKCCKKSIVKEIPERDETLRGLAEKLLDSNARSKSLAIPIFFVRNDSVDRKLGWKTCFLDTFDRNRKQSHTANPFNLHDTFDNCLLKSLDIPTEIFTDLVGFDIIGYKDKIVISGGERVLGSGNWNYDVLMYDTIRERWEIETQMPFGRRHFFSCICGPYLYIVGGVAKYRIVKCDFFCYNFESKMWSQCRELPCNTNSILCCNYNDQLFVINSHKAFIYDNVNLIATLPIVDDTDLLRFELNFTLFSYDGKVFLKGDLLAELTVEDTCVHCTKVKYLKPIFNDCDFYWVYSTLSNDDLLTMYKCPLFKTITIEKFNLVTHEKSIIAVPTSHKTLEYHTKFVTMSHYYAMIEDKYVNVEVTNQIQ